MKKVVRINENELKHMIMESVKKIMNEGVHTTDISDLLGMDDDTTYSPYNDGPDFEENNIEKIKEPTGNIKNCCDAFRNIMYAPHKDGEVQKTWNYMLDTYTSDELINGFKEFVKYYHR